MSNDNGLSPSVMMLRKASNAVHLACDQDVATHLQALLTWSANEIERLRAQIAAERRETTR